VEAAERTYVSVRFSPAGRAQRFLLAEGVEPPPAGASVVVRTESGAALGRAETAIPETAARRPPPDPTSPLRVVRHATQSDIVTRLKHEQREREGRQYAMDRIRALDLPMKLSRVEQPFDGSRLIFYFTAEARIDFRELVRDLAGRFRTRIEMRQIGVRDEAKMLGGYGSCGRPLCCTTWLTSFAPVSIRMAKQQDLSLNPSKLSGLCGRLKCCLRYELPNSKGVRGGGCGDEGSCDNPSGCGTGGCGSGGCGSGGCGSCGH
jgi:cell fate regulator YaaT (PSP1 superfamily)